MDKYETVVKLEKQRKTLRVMRVVRQILKWLVIILVTLPLVLLIWYLLYGFVYLEFVDDVEETIKHAPAILRMMDEGVYITNDYIRIGEIELPGNFFSIVWITASVVDIGFLIMYANYSDSFRKLYKETFVTPIIGEFFDDFQYFYREGFKQIQKFSLVKGGNNVISEDYLSGTYRDVKFEQAEVIVKRSSGCILILGNVFAIFVFVKRLISARTFNRKTKVGNRRNKTRTYFSGQMMKFSFPKGNVQSLHIFSKGYRHRPELAAASSKVVKMENVVFNENFDVLATDEHDAFYILTPQLQSRMILLLQRFESIAFHFSGNTLYIGFNSSNDAFDADIRKPIDYLKERRKIHNDLKIIKDVIDIILTGKEENI
ncbi:MAG: DUF3137 domain-containing protein [Wujia sp.]